jgi:hypothetical protein
LSCKATNLDDRDTTSKHDYNGHLKDETEQITNAIGVELRESFSAITALHDESFACSGSSEAFL